MAPDYRIAIVGAASLRGKELNESLAESCFAGSEFILMDDQEAIGQLESVGDEVTFIQPITPASFEHKDFAFFAGHPDVTRKHWRSALAAGASVIDLSCALEEEPGVLIRSPWVNPGNASGDAAGRIVAQAGRAKRSVTAASTATPDLETRAVVPAHPAAISLALVAGNLGKVAPVRSVSATVFEPASEHGRAAMDELHQQTVALLSFGSLPKAVYDIQVAFNAIISAGGDSKINLEKMESRIRRHYRSLSAGVLPPLSLQLIHLPVFHGYNFSIAVEFDTPAATGAVTDALAAEHLEVVPAGSDGPSNLTSAGQDNVLLRVRPGGDGVSPASMFWVWAAADNLKLAVSNAVACAEEIRSLRPRGKVQ